MGHFRGWWFTIPSDRGRRRQQEGRVNNIGSKGGGGASAWMIPDIRDKYNEIKPLFHRRTRRLRIRWRKETLNSNTSISPHKKLSITQKVMATCYHGQRTTRACLSPVIRQYLDQHNPLLDQESKVGKKNQVTNHKQLQHSQVVTPLLIDRQKQKHVTHPKNLQEGLSHSFNPQWMMINKPRWQRANSNFTGPFGRSLKSSSWPFLLHPQVWKFLEKRRHNKTS